MAFQCVYERGENRDGWEDGSEISERGEEWKLLILLCVDDLVLCDESEEDLVMVGHFDELCRRKGLKINADKSNVIVLGEEEGLEYEVIMAGACV